MFNKLDGAVKRYEKLTKRMEDPSIYDNQAEYKKVASERASLEDIVTTYEKYKKVLSDIVDVQSILKNEKDNEMREMAKQELSIGEKQKQDLEKELKILLLPKDELDDKNVIIEIRAGAGGDEASIFVRDIHRLYVNYCQDLGFKTELISVSQGSEGFKEVMFSVTGNRVYSKLKFESGVHRVQRVPKTESQGRIHTSTITVAVMPEAEEVDFQLDMSEVKIEVFRASGAGGQHVNTTDSAVRVTHIPTGIVVSNQDQKSQIKNKEKALKILRNRIYDKVILEKKAQEDAHRKGLIGTGDRSERIRTYNFPQGRLTDHRIGLTVYNLDKIMEGNLHEVSDSLVAHNQAELLKGDMEDD